MNPSIAYVPPEFKPDEQHLYPIDNRFYFERWFHDNYHIEQDVTDRFYLPIFFTAYLKNNNYAQDKPALARLQEFIDRLDKNRKYYGICQYDDGCVVDTSGIDLFMFSMAGQPCSYKLPLLCHPHGYKYPNEKRDIFCSFVGRVTHPLRQRMLGAIGKVRNAGKEYYVSLYNHPLSEYTRILAKSVFSLCPRGYSANSFRILESLEMGAIPVLISDEFFIPDHLNFNDFGVLIKEEDVYRIDTILESIPEDVIRYKQSRLQDIFEKYYTFEANKQIILKVLRGEPVQ